MSILTTWMELEVSAEYDYTPAEHGRRDRFGVPEEPDYPAEVEITKVMLGKVDIMESLSKSQLDSIEQDIWKDLAEPEDE